MLEPRERVLRVRTTAVEEERAAFKKAETREERHYARLRLARAQRALAALEVP